MLDSNWHVISQDSVDFKKVQEILKSKGNKQEITGANFL